MSTLSPASFRLIHHTDDLAGANDHFGALLYHADGRLAVHDGSRTWLYTGSLVEGRWVSYVRELDLEGFRCAEKRLVLTAHDDDDWATIHLVLEISPTLYVAFYSTGPAMRAAVAAAPDQVFHPVSGFRVSATEPWEKDCNLESDGGFVLVHEDDRELTGWVLYDTLGKETAGANGWLLVRIDKTEGSVSALRKHPGNPLPLHLPGRLAARTGGNLASDLRLAGKRALFFLSKPDLSTYRFAVALSDDPLFVSPVQVLEFADVLGREQVVEKFQAFERNGLLHLVYEVGPPGERHWRTGLRAYRVG